MADHHLDGPAGSPGPDPDRGEFQGMPRWVKVAGLIVVLLAVLVVVLLVLGGPGGHGPGRHGSASGSGTQVLALEHPGWA